MDDHRIAELAKLETTYWWHVGRMDIIRTILRQLSLPHNASIVDVGCGTGVNLSLLAEFGRVTGVDPSPLARRYAETRGAGPIVAGDAAHLPFDAASVDLITAFDVIEHVQDDAAALGEFARVLKPGATVFLLAPAYQFLWSEHDEALSHARRYTVSELHRKLDRAGFAVTRRSYCISFLFLPILLFRFFRSFFVRPHGPRTSYVIVPTWLNRFFVATLRLEAWLLRFANFPFGVTCLVVARKS